MSIRILSVSIYGLAWTVAAAPLVCGGEIDAHRLFRQLDADTDGQLSRDEAGAEHRLLFSRLVRTGDENGDGRLTVQEFATALTPVRAEKADVEKVPARLPGADALIVMLARMDADGDAQLEAAEIPEQYEPLYERMLARGDDDKDGRLDARELARGGPRLGVIAQLEAARMGIDVPAALNKLPQDRRAALEEMDVYQRVDLLMSDPEQAGKLFNRLDSNGDRQLAADEAPGPMAERFAGMLARGDRDGDERLSRREFLELARRFAAYQNAGQATPESRQVARQLLQRFDANRDRRLSRDEAPRRLERAFERADANGDANLDAEELGSMTAQFSRMQQMNRGEGAMADSPRANAAGSDAAAKSSRKARTSPAAKKARRDAN